MSTILSIIVVILCIGGIHCRIVVKPLGAHYTLGSTNEFITLYCNTSSDKNNIWWNFKGFDEYEKNSTTLVIKKVSKKEAGEYKCMDKDESACANVVVFESLPVSTHSIINGTHVELCYGVRYWGNIVPRIDFWKATGKKIKIVPHSNIINKSEILNEIRVSNVCIAVTNKNYKYVPYIFLPKDTKCNTTWQHSYIHGHEFENTFHPLPSLCRECVKNEVSYTTVTRKEFLDNAGIGYIVLKVICGIIGFVSCIFIINEILYHKKKIRKTLCPGNVSSIA